ncbi:hypothetical protein [Vibrio furnissii]|uniref:hypothetical protein n=1 Tax=Vibrio furnissii TaxID=29494 RepID=UPI0012AE8A7C|nr:hypothetical protein [Vibrio furnissii]
MTMFYVAGMNVATIRGMAAVVPFFLFKISQIKRMAAWGGGSLQLLVEPKA